MRKTVIFSAIIFIFTSGIFLFLRNISHIQKTQLHLPLENNTISSKQKFQASQYVGTAFKIAPGNLTSEAKQALSGFDYFQKDLGKGMIEIDLNPTKYGYKPHKIVVKPGYTLYFIEGNSDDDNDTLDTNLMDDSPLLVDSQGYIVSSQ